MTQPTADDPRHPLNLTDEEYQRRHKERAERIGDAGLHTVPEKYLEGRS